VEEAATTTANSKAQSEETECKNNCVMQKKSKEKKK